MIDLEGPKLESLPITGLTKVQDLDRHDGPLLSHMVHKRGDHYLFYWCDCQTDLHRWMLIRVSETNILRLIHKVVPLDLVIPRASLDDFVYFVDTGRQKELGCNLVAIDDIPAEYIPGKGAYIDVPGAASERSYSLLIEEQLSLEQIGFLPRLFSQAYAVLYALFVLKPQAYVEIPWRDGFGGMRFYRWLLDRIPGEDRPFVSVFRYASPGFIRFELDRKVADLVGKSVHDLQRRERSIGRAYNKLYSYIREKKPNDLSEKDTTAELWSPHNEELKRMTRALLDAAEINDDDALLLAAPPFEAAKVSLSFIRRLRELRKYESEGVVRFPKAFD